MKKTIISIVLLALPLVANANILRYSFTGSVTSIRDLGSDLSPSVTVGDTFQAAFDYDLDKTIESQPGGFYITPSAGEGLTISINVDSVQWTWSSMYMGASGYTGRLEVTNSKWDVYSAYTGSSNPGFASFLGYSYLRTEVYAPSFVRSGIGLPDETGMNFTSPISATDANFTLISEGATGHEWQITFRINEGLVTSIPEPSTFGFLAALAVLVIALTFRRLRHYKEKNA